MVQASHRVIKKSKWVLGIRINGNVQILPFFIPMACLALCCLCCLRCRYANNGKKASRKRKKTINQSRTFFQPRIMMHRCDVHVCGVLTQPRFGPIRELLEVTERNAFERKLITFKMFYVLPFSTDEAFCLPPSLLVLASRSTCSSPMWSTTSPPSLSRSTTTAGSSLSSDPPP